jgi:hypothetical protein
VIYRERAVLVSPKDHDCEPSQQLLPVVMGPGLRQDDGGGCGTGGAAHLDEQNHNLRREIPQQLRIAAHVACGAL